MTFDLQRITQCINKSCLIPIRLQLFKWGKFSHFQPIFQLDLKWTLTFIYDLWPHRQMQVWCCIYDLNLLEMHQSLWKLESNVKSFSRQINNRLQGTKWSIFCVFPGSHFSWKKILMGLVFKIFRGWQNHKKLVPFFRKNPKYGYLFLENYPWTWVWVLSCQRHTSNQSKSEYPPSGKPSFTIKISLCEIWKVFYA